MQHEEKCRNIFDLEKNKMSETNILIGCKSTVTELSTIL